MIQIPLEIGDTILAGRFKNKKITVKETGTDEYGNPTVNGRSILKIRIPKLYQKQENIQEMKEPIKYIGYKKDNSGKVFMYVESIQQDLGSDFKGSVIKFGYLNSKDKNPKKLKGWYRINKNSIRHEKHGIIWEDGSVNIDIKQNIQENNMKLNENIQELDGTKEGAQEAISIIENGLQGQVPYVEVTSGLIGRWDYLHIRVIFEKKEDWKNNIKQNAAQFVMTLTSDGTLQESHRHLYIPSKRPHYALDSLPIKFRKTKVKSLQDVISKISKYIQEVKKSFASEGHPLKENNRKLREAAKPFSKQTNVKIKQENKRWHIYLETVDGDECLTPIGFETKELAEHAAMMKGYNFKGNPYSEDYEGLEVEKPTKREKTKGTEKPEEMKLSKEKEIKLESMIRRVIHEEIGKKSSWVKVEVGSGLTLNAYKCPKDLIKTLSSSPRVDKKNANKPGYVFAQLDSESPYRWFKLAEAKFSKKKVKLKENIDKQKIRKQLEDYIQKTWSKKPYKGQIRFKGDLLVIDNAETDFGDYASSIATAATGKKWNHVNASIAKLTEMVNLKEELSQSELEQKARRFAELAQKMKAMEAELKQMELEYTNLDQELTPLVEQVGKTKDTFIRAGKLLIKIEREGYERKNASYKTGFEYLYNKVNATMKDLAEEALKMTQTVSYVKSKISVVQGESNLKEENWFQKIKNFLNSKVKKLFGLTNQANKELEQLESKI